MSGRRGGHREEEIPTLYVRQVHYSARPDDLRALFERMGPVRDVYIPLDYYTRESRGFAYIKFEFTRDAEDALRELNGASVLGRRIEVEWAEGQRKTKTEMRARDPYGPYRGRGRYRSRSPYRSGRERTSRRRSRSKRRSRSRSKRRSYDARRYRSGSRHRQSNTKPKNSRSPKSSSPSVRKNRDKRHKIKRLKSSSVRGSLPCSENESRNRIDEQRDAFVNEVNVSNQRSAVKLEEAAIDELEVRSEARASDIEIDEKQIQKAVKENGDNEYLEDAIGVTAEGNSVAAREMEDEEEKTAADIEVIDEVIEQNGIILNDIVVEDNCTDEKTKVHELLVMDTVG